jgi:hypothetical protein
MDVARETSSKDQPVVRKTEPAASGDVWQRFHWSRDEGNNVVNKVLPNNFKYKSSIVRNLWQYINVHFN